MFRITAVVVVGIVVVIMGSVVIISHRRVNLEYSNKAIFAATGNEIISPNGPIGPRDVPHKTPMSSKLNGMVKATIGIRAINLDGVHGGYHERQTLTIRAR